MRGRTGLTDQLNKLNLISSVTELPGVGPNIKSKLMKLGINTVQDLLFQLPIKYQNRTKITQINESTFAEEVQVEGTIISTKTIYRGRQNLICEIEDNSGQLILRFINFNFSQKRQLQEGKLIRCFGSVRTTGRNVNEMIHPEYKIYSEGCSSPLPNRLSPIYPLTAGISQRMLIKLKKYALAILDLCEEEEIELLPLEIREKYQLQNINKILPEIHFPRPHLGIDRVNSLKRDLAFEELLAQQIHINKLKSKTRKKKSVIVKPGALRAKFLKILDFSLTRSQIDVVKEIDCDLSSGVPMQRILQGDVGSGKTVVAAAIALNIIEEGFKVALMAPTELLAEQHYKTFKNWLNKLNIDVYLLLGKTQRTNRDQIYTILKDEKPLIVIGTHTLFQEALIIEKLGLCIIDEQHRFGVQQRKKLEQKGCSDIWQNHVLMMSATPIPRTLSLTIFGALDISTIKRSPIERKQVITSVVQGQRREEVVNRINSIFQLGQQVFWVCPLIDADASIQKKAASLIAEDLSKRLGKSKIGLLHGKMDNLTKEIIMSDFLERKIDLLVATTVIEVGIDVPNATLIVIDGPENMGLAQLHQLRGRVGRGSKQGFCILLYGEKLSANGRKKLEILRDSTDGFYIAEKDLEIRGPGQLLGKQQSGLPTYKIADLVRDNLLIERAIKISRSEIIKDNATKTKLLKRWKPDEIYLNTF